MNLFTRLLDLLLPHGNKDGAPLRNKPGGLAWINSRVDEGDGSHVLVNRIVTTVRFTEQGLWEIDPPQPKTRPRWSYDRYSRSVFRPGQEVLCVAISDDCLTPIPDNGITEEEVRELFAPQETQKA